MSKKYELIKHDPDGKLWRIRALRDIPRHGVKAGDLGGIVSGEYNLSQHGDAWITKNARVTDRARVDSNALVTDAASVRGDAYISDNARIGDSALIHNHAVVCDNATVHGKAFVAGWCAIRDRAQIGGGARLGGTEVIGSTARISRTNHVFSVTGMASRQVKAILYRTADGYHLEVGCWTGTVEELHALADSDDWPSGCDEETRVKYRPQLHALADLCAAQISLWGDNE